MTNPTSPEISIAPAYEQGIELPQGIPLSQKVHNLGRAAVVVACTSLTLWGMRVTEASASTLTQATPPPITQTLNPNVIPPAPQPADPTVYRMPGIGVATGSYDDDGLGYHTLFKDMAAEGMTTVRLNYVGLKELRAEVASARANDIDPTVVLPGISSQQDAQIAAQLPSVNTFDDDNEPNSDLFSDRTPEEAVEHVAQTTAAVHAVRPDAEVLGFALASGYNPIAFLTAANQIADQDFGGLQNIMDGLDIHLYRSLPKDLQMIQAYEQIYPGPIYIGELGWIVGDPDHPGAVSLADQANNEIAFLTAVSQDPQIQSIDFFRYRATPTDPFDTANVAADGSLRPAYYVLQSLLAER